MPMKASVVDAIGRTPLIALRARLGSDRLPHSRQGRIHESRRLGEGPRGARDHPGRRSQGALRKGGVIVEGTAGNTGIGLGMVASALGYRTVIVIPDTQTQEKKDMLRLVGAELIEVPAVALLQPQQLREIFRPARRRRWPRPSRTARSGPTSSTMSPTAAAITKRRVRKSTTTPAARSTASSARSAPAARWPASAWR